MVLSICMKFHADIELHSGHDFVTEIATLQGSTGITKIIYIHEFIVLVLCTFSYGA